MLYVPPTFRNAAQPWTMNSNVQHIPQAHSTSISEEMASHRKDLNMSLFLIEFFICVIFKILPLVVCLTISMPSYEHLLIQSGGFQSIMRNWNRSMITDIYHSRPFTNCTAGFEPLFKGKWLGTKEGCDCSKVQGCVYWNSKRSHGLLKRKKCSKTDIKCGCSKVSPTLPRDLYSWNQENGLICVKREPGLSYEYIYDNVHSDGSCKKGFKRCGQQSKPNSSRNIGHFLSKDRSICIPPNFKCPVNSLVIYPSKTYNNGYKHKPKRPKGKHYPVIPKGWTKPSSLKRRLTEINQSTRTPTRAPHDKEPSSIKPPLVIVNHVKPSKGGKSPVELAFFDSFKTKDFNIYFSRTYNTSPIIEANILQYKACLDPDV